MKILMSVITIYELTMNERSQTGLVACVSIDDYENEVCKKKHENYNGSQRNGQNKTC